MDSSRSAPARLTALLLGKEPRFRSKGFIESSLMLAGITPMSRNSLFSVFLALSNTSRLSSPVISVAFHVRVEVPSVEICRDPGSAWANPVSGPHFKKLISKKKRVNKRIVTMRIKGNYRGVQGHEVREDIVEEVISVEC